MKLRNCVITTPNEVIKEPLFDCVKMLFTVLRIYKVPFSQVSFYEDEFGNCFVSAPNFELCVCTPNLSKE